MKWILWTLAMLAALVLLMALAGWLLPVQHEASRTAVVRRTPEQVYSTITNVTGYPGWFEGVTRVEVLPSANGPLRFRQHGANGAIVMEITETRPSSRVVTRIADPDQPFGGTWTFDIAADGEGSRVTITERGEVYNPIFRFLSRFVFGHAATIEACLRSLQRHAG